LVQNTATEFVNKKHRNWKHMEEINEIFPKKLEINK
jgi:hypothetical protein